MIMCVRIHQVRSVGNNVAVNIWWRHHLNSNVDINDCLQFHNNVIDPMLTLDKVTLHGVHLDYSDTHSLRL